MFVFRYGIFVDAGYVFGQGALSLSVGKPNRSLLRLDEAAIIAHLKSIVPKTEAELLRIYWYDGTRGGMTVEQTTLAELPDVKVRLGYINGAGQQKGVDSLIITDLIELARNQAISDAYLISGDGDLRVAVQIAQSFGVRVHLITLEPSKSSLNQQLGQEVDTRHEIAKSDVVKFLHLRQPPSAGVPPFPVPLTQAPQPAVASTKQVSTSPTPITQVTGQPASTQAAPTASQAGPAGVEEAAKQAIKTVFSSVSPEELSKLKALQLNKVIPAEYDGKILGTCRALLGRDLSNPERSIMRRLVLAWLAQS